MSANYPDLPRRCAKFAEYPEDYDGAGCERYYDQTPEQRAASLSTMLRESEHGQTEGDKRFARSWLSALRTAREQVTP